MRTSRLLSLGAVATFGALTGGAALSPVSGSAQATAPDAATFFESKIRPLLIAHCFDCHGEKQQMRGLRLDSRAAMLAGGESGPALVPGDPDKSRLLRVVRYDGSIKMPPTGKLAPNEIAALTAWVKMGAPWPDVKPGVSSAPYVIPAEKKNFWSFRPVRRPPLPKVKKAAWVKSPLDRFVLAKLEAKGLMPAPPADKRTLLRRATFDLTGLPPTPTEIDAFLRDKSPNAFAKVVDRLLASPAYGERWGRHWLDVVRYCDSLDSRGIGSDGDISEAWRYRDWVVNAFNSDMPYTEFIVNQIAGDLLPPKRPGDINTSGIIATGMLAIGNWGNGDADKEKLLTDIADDQVDVVSRGFMGLTVACARCHDHKFDPIPTTDYYGMAGIFFSTHILPKLAPKGSGETPLRIPLLPKTELEQRDRYAAQVADLEKRIQQEKAHPNAGRALLAKWTADLDTLKKQALPPVPYANGAQEGGCPESPQAGFHDVRVHIRGSYARLGALVPRHFPIVLAGENQKPIPSGSGRLELARWLASASHPLTARVIVNRLWEYHFGEGIVRTPSNFGFLGERPTHPELLDWLASGFVRSGWSLKKLHRAIMLSATYQQSSSTAAHNRALDPDNRWFGRMNRRRLEAEAVRDNLLAVAGRLDTTMGGPSVLDFAVPRRTLYITTIRSDRSGFGPLFDAADSTASVDRRAVSTVAPQALFLLNNPFAMEQTKALAKRLLSENLPDDTARIRRAYLLLYGRPAVPEEIKIGLAFLSRARQTPGTRAASLDASDAERTAWTAYCQILLCANEFIYVD